MLKKYTKAVIFSRFILIISTLFVVLFCLLEVTAFAMQLFIYRPINKDTIVANAAMIVPMTMLIIVFSVLFRSYFSALRKIEAELDVDLKEYVEYCEKIILGRYFFFEDHFISFDNPVTFGYEQIKEVHCWSKSQKRKRYYFIAVVLNDGRSYKMNCHRKSQRELAEEFEIRIPYIMMKNNYSY